MILRGSEVTLTEDNMGERHIRRRGESQGQEVVLKTDEPDNKLYNKNNV